MLKPRLIPVLLFRNGILVRSQQFDFYQSTGDPIGQVERFTAWKADELIYLDITEGSTYNTWGTMQMIGSSTSKKNLDVSSASDFLDVVREVAKRCFVPLTVGGKIRTIEDARIRLKSGADKVSINTAALARPEFITELAREFGSQAIVVSIDVLEKGGRREVYAEGGAVATNYNPVAWAQEAASRGAGEILLNSIDRDGMGNGYDCDGIRSVAEAVSIPVIALGGVGDYHHFADGIKAKASAVAAANFFHFREQSIIEAKKVLVSDGVSVRL